jgi:type IV pilus assembly protein PilO
MTSGMRKVIFFVLLAAISYFAYAYMIRPGNRLLMEQKLQLKSKLEKLRELEQASAAASDLSKQLEELERAITFFESKLPPESQIDKVLEQVTVIAQQQGLEPKTIFALKRKDCNGYIEQPLRMELYGSFNSYYSFLLALERLDRITKIRELELKKDSREEGVATAKFIVSIFFQNMT